MKRLIAKASLRKLNSLEANKSLELPISKPDLSIENNSLIKPMTYQEVTPPSYIWDNIAKVLDEQDRMKETNALLNSIVYKGRNNKAIFFAALIMFGSAMLYSII